MKKSLLFVAGLLLASNMLASTPYKNLYAEVTAYPAGAGTVYLTSKTGDADYIAAASEDYDETAFIKFTPGENGNDYQKCEGFCADATGEVGSGAAGMYEAVLYILPEDGYEFVCLANQIAEDGIYYPAICYQSHTGENAQSYVFSWEFSTEEGNLINVDNPAHISEGDNHGPDANTGDPGGIGQSGVFALGTWGETPDTKMYAIFRKIGDELPKFGVEAGIQHMNANADQTIYDITGIQLKSITTAGIYIVNGKKVIIK